MTNLPTPYAAARIAAFLNDHLSWSAYWDKRYGLWRVAEDDTDSDLYAESQDADVVIGYMRTHVRDTRSRRGVMTPRNRDARHRGGHLAAGRALRQSPGSTAAHIAQPPLANQTAGIKSRHFSHKALPLTLDRVHK